MALSAQERAEVEKFILDFQEHQFAPMLARYYAAGVSYAGRHPSNINNELRNALTHMSRALVAEDKGAVERELTAAARHIDRFKRDCLKMAVIYAGKNVSQMIRHAEITYGRFDPNIALEIFELAKRKYIILASEVLGDHDAASKWETLFLDIEKLREKVLQSYRLLDTKKYWLPIIVFRAWRLFKWAWTGIGLAIVAMALWALMVPDQQGFGKTGQKYIERIAHDAFTIPRNGVIHSSAAKTHDGRQQ